MIEERFVAGQIVGHVGGSVLGLVQRDAHGLYVAALPPQQGWAIHLAVHVPARVGVAFVARMRELGWVPSRDARRAQGGG